MSLCIGATGEDYALVASDCFSGRTPERSAELGGRVASLPGGWLTYTTLEDGMAKVAAGRLEAAGFAAYQPRALQQQVATVYNDLAPRIRGRRMGPDTGDHGIEAAFYVASAGPQGCRVWMIFSDDVGKAINPGQAHVSPPPEMDDDLQARWEDNALREYVADAQGVWTAMRRAAEVQREVRQGCGYVSRHMHLCAVAPEDGTWSKWALFGDSDELAEMGPDAIREMVVRFEGCVPPEVLQERRAAAAGGT